MPEVPETQLPFRDSPPDKTNPWIIVIVVVVVLCCFCIGSFGLIWTFWDPFIQAFGFSALLPVLTWLM
jgi:hypothetical protein